MVYPGAALDTCGYQRSPQKVSGCPAISEVRQLKLNQHHRRVRSGLGEDQATAPWSHKQLGFHKEKFEKLQLFWKKAAQWTPFPA